MTPTQPLAKVLDLTGLPDDAFVAIHNLVAVLRRQVAKPPPADLSYEEWKTRFDEWRCEVRSRAKDLPPGHFVDDSRESIYEGRGE